MSRRRSPGEGSISRRKGGGWVGQIVTGTTTHGSTRRRTVYGRTKGEVLRKLDALKIELHGGVDGARRLTFGQLADLWLANRKAGLKWTTWQAYSRTLKKHGAALWRRPLVAIRPLELDAHLRDLERAKVPSAARATYRERIRQVFKYAVAKRLLTLSPADSLEVPKHRPSTRRTWERGEVAAFLAAARETRLYPLFYLALATGLRAGELLGLQWPDVDLDAAVLTVQHTWGPGPDGQALGEPKTARSKRTIPLPPDVLEVLAGWRTAWMQERVFQDGVQKWRGSDFVFSWPTGQPMSADTLARELDHLIIAAGLPRLTMHGLRHSYATLALRAGLPVQVLSERLGHTRTSLTMDIYVGVLAEQREAGALSMEKLLSDPDAVTMQYSGNTKQVLPS
jgi:integrase